MNIFLLTSPLLKIIVKSHLRASCEKNTIKIKI